MQRRAVLSPRGEHEAAKFLLMEWVWVMGIANIPSTPSIPSRAAHPGLWLRTPHPTRAMALAVHVGAA
jgi:hypothetical protein